MSENTADHDPTDYDDVPVACTLDEAGKEQRRDWVAETLVDALRGAQEREDGCEFVFEGTDDVLTAAATFVQRESKCCAFARFRIDVPQGFDEVRLLFAGPEGTKDLLEVGLLEEFDVAG